MSLGIHLGHKGRCFHNQLLVDDELAMIECKDCGEKLNPFFAIKRLMRLSDKWRSERAALNLAREQAEKKKRTKCEHCKKMTIVRVKITGMQIVQRQKEMDLSESSNQEQPK